MDDWMNDVKMVFASGLGPSSTAALMKPAEFRTSTASQTQRHITHNAFHTAPSQLWLLSANHRT